MIRWRRHRPPDLQAAAATATAGLYHSIDALFEALIDVTQDPYDLLVAAAERDLALEPILDHGRRKLRLAQPEGLRRQATLEALDQWLRARRDPPPIAQLLHHLAATLRSDPTLPIPVRWLQETAINHHHTGQQQRQ